MAAPPDDGTSEVMPIEEIEDAPGEEDESMIPDTEAESAAVEEAASKGSPVEVDALATESRKVVAHPDGRVVAEIGLEPFRVRDGAEWRDAGEAKAAESIAMVASQRVARSRSLASGAASSLLATADLDGLQFGFTWPGELPEPEQQGLYTFYRDVKPDVDLVVKHSWAGFETHAVVHTREAARALASSGVEFGTRGGRIRHGDGGYSVVDGEGVAKGVLPPLLMWDATGATRSSERDLVGLIDGMWESRQRVIDAEVGPDNLVLKPDADFIDDPDTFFLVVIDPVVSSVKLADNKISYGSYRNQWRTTDLLVGLDYFAPTFHNHLWRTMFSFDTEVFKNKHITKGTISLMQYHSPRHVCGKNSPVALDLYTVGRPSSGTRWNKQPVWSRKPIASTTFASGHSKYCDPAVIELDVTSVVKLRYDRLSFGLKAANERSNAGWRRFHSRFKGGHWPRLTVVYEVYPKNPHRPRPVVRVWDEEKKVFHLRAGENQFSATLNHAKASQRMRFQVMIGKKGIKTKIYTSGVVKAGQKATLTVPHLAAGWYWWKFRAIETGGDGLASTWINGAALDVLSPPRRPALWVPPRADQHESKTGKITGYGQVTKAQYRINGGSPQELQLDSRRSAMFPIPTSRSGSVRVEARTIDIAGNHSPWSPEAKMVVNEAVPVEPTPTPNPSEEPVEVAAWGQWLLNGSLDHAKWDAPLVAQGSTGVAYGEGVSGKAGDQALLLDKSAQLRGPEVMGATTDHTLMFAFNGEEGDSDPECSVLALEGASGDVIASVGLKDDQWIARVKDSDGKIRTLLDANNGMSSGRFQALTLRTDKNTIQVRLTRDSEEVDEFTGTLAEATRGRIVVGATTIGGRALSACVGLVDDVLVYSGQKPPGNVAPQMERTRRSVMAANAVQRDEDQD